jgi:hypothetical protein
MTKNASQDFIALIPKEFMCSIVISECVVVVKNLGWRSNKNKSCRSQKIIQLYSVDNFFIWNHLEFSHSKFEIFQTTSDEEATKTKVVDLKKLFNFVFDNFFTWNHLSNENYGWIFSYLKFKIFKWPWMEKWPKPKLWILKSYKTL